MFWKAICFFLLNCIFSEGNRVNRPYHGHHRLTYPRHTIEYNCGPFAVVLCGANDIGLHPFPYDCNKYIQCEGGQTIIRECDDGFSFNKQGKICNTAHTSNCQLQMTVRRHSQTTDRTSVITTESTVYSTDSYREHPRDCAKYYDCTNRVCSVRHCPENSAFNTDINLCDKVSKVDCGSRSTENIIIKSDMNVSRTTVHEAEASCRTNTPPIQAHPSACWKYIRCVQGVSYIENCPTGQGFSTTYKKCIPNETCASLFRENIASYNTYGSRTSSVSVSQTQSSLNETNFSNSQTSSNSNGSGRDITNPSLSNVNSSTVDEYGGTRFDTVEVTRTEAGGSTQYGSDSGSFSQYDENGNSYNNLEQSSNQYNPSQPTIYNSTVEEYAENGYDIRTGEIASHTQSSSTQYDTGSGIKTASSTRRRGYNSTRQSNAEVGTVSTSSTGIRTSTNTLYEALQLESVLGSNHMGSVQIKINGTWYYVCDDKFDINAANVFCKEIGFHLGARQLLPNSYFVTAEIKNRKRIELTTFNEVVCQGDEISLKKCEFNSWDTSRCNAEEVVGVVCKLPHKNRCNRDHVLCATQDQCIPRNKLCDGIADCSDLSDEVLPSCNRAPVYRLIDGRGPNEGRLQVKYQGKWGTICDDGFDNLEAQVFCNSKGYNGHATFSRGGFGYGYGPIWLTQHSCTRVDLHPNLASCNTGTYAPTNCQHSGDIRIKCT